MDNPAADVRPGENDSVRKHIGSAVSAIAISAFGIFCFGAVFDAAWPAAAACCGLSVMGTAVAYIMVRAR